MKHHHIISVLVATAPLVLQRPHVRTTDSPGDLMDLHKTATSWICIPIVSTALVSLIDASDPISESFALHACYPVLF